MIVLGPGLLRAAVAVPLATLVICYMVARPQPEYPTFFPSAIFSRGEPPRITASLGFGGISTPMMALLGAVRHLRDTQRCGAQHSLQWLRNGAFAGMLLGLQGAATIPYPVSRALHGFSAALFFVAAALDLLLQMPLQRRLSGVWLIAPRVLGVTLCAMSLVGQMLGSRPLMSFGELGFAVVYLGILGLEVRELEVLNVRLVIVGEDQHESPLNASLSSEVAQKEDCESGITDAKGGTLN